MSAKVTINAIVCVALNGGIGNANKLLGKTPGDLSHFKHLTEGDALFMGYKTADSLPGGNPLKDRLNYVLCYSDAVAYYAHKGFIPIVAPNAPAGLRKACQHYESLSVIGTSANSSISSIERTMWIAGGGAIYEETRLNVSSFYVTVNPTLPLEADTFFNIRGIIPNYYKCKERFVLDEETATICAVYNDKD